MKLLIASDIHGSSYYAQRLIDAFYEEKADKLLLLGDITYHGPKNALPKEYNPPLVYDILNKEKNNILCVQGNCDSDVDSMLLAFPNNAPYIIIYDGKYTIFATHGHLFNKEKLPPMSENTIFVQGHTHVPEITEYPSYIFANPGSVSIPKSDFGNSYLVYENGILVLKHLE